MAILLVILLAKFMLPTLHPQILFFVLIFFTSRSKRENANAGVTIINLNAAGNFIA